MEAEIVEEEGRDTEAAAWHEIPAVDVELCVVASVVVAKWTSMQSDDQEEVEQ